MRLGNLPNTLCLTNRISLRICCDYGRDAVANGMTNILVTSCAAWQYFTSIHDWQFQNSYVVPDVPHSEYYFGKCRKEEGYIFYSHSHLDHMEVLGKIIIRSWIDVPRIPTCIILRATSHPEDVMRSTSHNFQMCVPRITYCHSHQRFKYYYFEWYIPEDMEGGMNWDLYFYGPPSLYWE